MHSYIAFLMEIKKRLKRYLKEMDIPGVNCLGKNFSGTKLKIKFQLLAFERKVQLLMGL